MLKIYAMGFIILLGVRNLARLKRIKIKGQDAYYHVMSRTVGQEFLLNAREKDKFIELLNSLSELFFVKIIGFSIMSNHFHLLIKMECTDEFSDNKILDRLGNYNKKDFELSDEAICKYRRKLGDISEYVKILKQKFSYWYNRQNNRKGHFWSDRFKSVLIESGESLLNCLAYIDLNSIRAKITDTPEDYKWSSIACRIKNNNEGKLLSMDGVEGILNSSSIDEYRNYLYFAGRITELDLKNRVENSNTSSYHIQPGILREKMEVFSNSVVMGSHRFIEDSYKKFGDTVLVKKTRKAYESGFSKKIFIAQRKYEQRLL